MAYVRYRVRGRLLALLEEFPETLSRESLVTLNKIIAGVSALRQEVTNEPFEYIDDATVNELSELAVLFAKALGLLFNTLNYVRSEFDSGVVSFPLPADIKSLRDDLLVKTEGMTATGRLLANFSKNSKVSKLE